MANPFVALVTIDALLKDKDVEPGTRKEVVRMLWDRHPVVRPALAYALTYPRVEEHQRILRELVADGGIEDVGSLVLGMAAARALESSGLLSRGGSRFPAEQSTRVMAMLRELEQRAVGMGELHEEQFREAMDYVKAQMDLLWGRSE